jgi:E3 ubiquitin-protein ligase MARCH6
VRDVLERNLVTQLRKILFSAFIYGTLVVVCLGGVVWSLSWAAPTVLPIQYASNEPILEFPVDLLFYNFFMPLAFKFFKPGDSLQKMYQWCFRKSARILRLTYFLFGERCIDEEGTLQMTVDSPHQTAPFWQRYFLGLNRDKTRVIPKDWPSIINGTSRKGKQLDHELKYLRIRKAKLESTGQIVADGRFVKAPASDRVKIPKGQQVFLEVNDRGKRKDGKPIEGLHASEQFQTVYLPPHLLTRIFLFILLIWSFAVVTGLSLTIIPLMIGRALFKMTIPDHVHTNDIYAFCVGLHIICPILYGISQYRRLYAKAETWLWRGKIFQLGPATSVFGYLVLAAKMMYAYTVVFGATPMVLAIMVELYISLPAHTLRNPPTVESLEQGAKLGDSGSQHNLRVVELWTLGLLYMKIGTKLVKSFMPNSRFAAAIRSIFRRGWLQPEVRVLTRAFVLPGLLLGGFAIFAPPLGVRLFEIFSGVELQGLQGDDAVRRVHMYRRAYPILLSLGLLVKYFITIRRGYKALKVKIRDDTYLMGERLQNYDGTQSNMKARVKISMRRV